MLHNHAAFQEQVARCGAYPGINGDWRIPVLSAAITRRMRLSCRCNVRTVSSVHQTVRGKSIRYHFGAGVLNQVGFTRLVISVNETVLIASDDGWFAPSGKTHIEVTAHPFQRSAWRTSALQALSTFFAVASRQLHELVLSNNQRVQLTIDFLLDGSRSRRAGLRQSRRRYQ